MRASHPTVARAFAAFVAFAIWCQIAIEHASTAWAGNDPVVAFNTKTLKFHHPECDAAKRCAVNCIMIPRSVAIHRGGVACKHCGGGLRFEPRWHGGPSDTQYWPDGKPRSISHR